MPYIVPELRDYFEPNCPSAEKPGELNFQITCLINKYLKHKGFKHNGLNYDTINDILGAIEGSKLEFNRRIAAPYEDGKIESNGDVYE